MNIEPIVPKRLSRSIIEQIVRFIVNDDLRVGDRLPAERELAMRFQVSRPSVREALRVLEVMGLVETRPGGGSFITDLNIAPFLSVMAPLFLRHKGYDVEFMELRILLELKAAELAAAAGSSEKDKILRPPVERMKTALETKDSDAGVRADIDFHKAVFQLADSFILQKAAEFVVSALEYSVSYSRKIILERAGSMDDLYTQHLAIYEAVRDGRPEEARLSMENHLNYALKYYVGGGK